MKTWTVKLELMDGFKLTLKVQATTANAAVDAALAQMGERVGNILSVRDSHGELVVCGK